MKKEKEYIIGIDLGTGSCRGTLFDREANLIDQVSRSYPIISPHPGWDEQDPKILFQTLVKVLKEIIARVPKSGKLLVIGLSGYFHSLIALDSQGEPLTNCIIWTDTRSQPCATELRRKYDTHKIYLRTGCPIHPMYPLSRIIWLRENRPDVFRKTRKFVSIKEYAIWKLYEKFLADWSLASGTGFFNIHKLDWDDELLEITGISRTQLSTLVSPEHIMTDMKKEYANVIDVSPSVPLVIGAGDGVLSNLGSGAIGIGEANNTIGTGGAIRVIYNRPVLDEKERTWCYVLSKGYWGIGALSLGGFSYQWFKEKFGQLESMKARETGRDPYVILDRYATEVPLGSEGLIFLPFLTGELSPHWRADARGIIVGLSAHHTKKHFVRAIMEGVCFCRYSCFKALQEVAGEINSLRATGGFTKSREWLQIMSDMLGKELLIPRVSEATSLGAAVLALKAIGELSNLKEVKDLVSFQKSIKPNMRNHLIYKRIYKVYNEVYERLKGTFSKIYNLEQEFQVENWSQQKYKRNGGENVLEGSNEVMALHDRLDDLTRQVERLKKIVSGLEQDVSILKRPWL